MALQGPNALVAVGTTRTGPCLVRHSHWCRVILARRAGAALTDSRLDVLIVTPPYLASGFIWQEEMPRIMAHREDGMEVLPLIVRPCAWRVMPELESLQARPLDAVPLSSVSEAEADGRLAEFTYELAIKLDRIAGNVADDALRSTPERTRSTSAAEVVTGESERLCCPQRERRRVNAGGSGVSDPRFVPPDFAPAR